ncbi:MAG: aspartate kinase [Bacteroidales bacterium]
MKVFKFGGASVKDASGVRNLFRIVSSEADRPLVLVVSAMGKTTNALEGVLKLARENRAKEAQEAIEQIIQQHKSICKDLFSESHPVFEKLDEAAEEMEQAALRAQVLPYNQAYDQLVGLGEIVSTQIVSAFFNDNRLSHQWLDARQFIRTDSNWRMASVLMEETRNAIRAIDFAQFPVILTQGFIGSNAAGEMTTLGREGSDYTAALFAWALSAESLTLWKDVPGVMSADPAVYADAETYSFIPYREAVELTYYGASVIHPKTIKPLENADIPLFVKSFKDPSSLGTRIAAGDVTIPATPSRIRKTGQVLITLKPSDLAFVTESMMAEVLQEFHQAGIRINLMQNSALSLSFCLDYDPVRIDPLLHSLSSRFKVKYNTGLTLLTIRHYAHQPEIIFQETQNRKVMVEQRSRSTAQFIFSEKDI